MGKNKQVLCKVCYRSMRSDNLKRHLQGHIRFREIQEQNTKGDHSAVGCDDTLPSKDDIKYEGNKNEEDSEKDDCNNEDEQMTEGKYLQTNTEGLRKRMIVKDKEYTDKVKLGGEVYEIILENQINQTSLDQDLKEALNIFMQERKDFNVGEFELRPWQKDLMKLMNEPTKRQVIWIKGRAGNEGKSWMQEYIQSYYGTKRVVRLAAKNKTSNIAQVLRKRQLATTDIFMFNDARSKNQETVNYEMLENIKDGQAEASKYNSEIIKFRTPNIVVVFSNENPERKELSSDRWNVFKIDTEMELQKV